jgi:O-antigen/teichoic acid export membrane protein
MSTPQGVTDQKSLDKALVGGFAWTAGVKWCGQIVSWVISLVVARLLTPADFGLVGMATIYLGLITLFSEFGVGTAVITLRELDEVALAQLHTTSLILGVLAFLLSCLLAAPLGMFFREPRLPLVLIVTSTGFILLGYRTVPYALLQKAMKFKLLAFLDGFQLIVQALTTVVLAVLGFKFWALVIGGLAGTTASAVLPFVWQPQPFRRPHWRRLQQALQFSWRVCVARLSWYAYDNSDFLVVGRLLGDASLGAYSMAWNLAHIPMEKFTTLVNRVTPSLFSAVQTDLAALRRYLRCLTEGVSLVTFPATFGIALVAPEFVQLALGPKWLSAILPLQFLVLHASLRSVRALLSPLLNALGEAHFVMRNTLLSLVVLPISFIIGSRWGLAGVASCWVLIFPLLCIPLYRVALRKIEMPVTEYLKAIWPAISGSVTLALAVWLLKWTIPQAWPLYLRFFLEIAVGASAYCLTLVTLHRDRLSAFYSTFQMLRGRAS